MVLMKDKRGSDDQKRKDYHMIKSDILYYSSLCAYQNIISLYLLNYVMLILLLYLMLSMREWIYGLDINRSVPDILFDYKRFVCIYIYICHV